MGASRRTPPLTAAELAAERWREIEDWPGYDVSDMGRVRSWKRRLGKGHGSRYAPDYSRPPLLKRPTLLSLGYMQVILSDEAVGKQNFRVCRLVLAAFRGAPPAGCEAAHRNGTSTDDRLTNLRWATSLDNAHDKFAHGTVLQGEKHPRARLSADDVRAIRKARASGETSLALAARFKVRHTTILKIEKRQLWGSID